MLGELWIRCSLSVHLYGEGGVLSLTCIPRPSPNKMHIEREYNDPNRRSDIAQLKALQLSVWTEKRICTQEEIHLPCKIRGAKAFAFFDS